MITREYNYMRKSQRVNIPLLVVIENEVYKVSDWSMTGVGILELKIFVSIGDKLSAKLILPVQNASIHLEVTIICRNKRDKITGFEFLDLTDRNKRVLRHYVELMLEGKIDNLEDLVSDFSMPEIETPIKEALNMTEEEQMSLLRKFRSRGFLALFAGISLALFILFTLFYNTILVYKTVGVVVGNIIHVTSGKSGDLKRIYVRVGDEIHVNDVLFDLYDFNLLEKIEKNSAAITNQHEKLNEVGKTEDNDTEDDILALLLQEFKRKEKEYQNARRLFENGAISIKDFQFVENSWSNAKISYKKYKQQKDRTTKTVKEKRDLIQLKIDYLTSERQELLKQLEELRIKSQINGVVYNVSYSQGEHVAPDDVIMTLATRRNPYILFKIPSHQSARVNLGMNARVYSFETGKTYDGTISSIGYSSINPRSNLLQEVSLEQTVIKVDLAGPAMDMPLNSRVEVWVKKSIPFVNGWLHKEVSDKRRS